MPQIVDVIPLMNEAPGELFRGMVHIAPYCPDVPSVQNVVKAGRVMDPEPTKAVVESTHAPVEQLYRVGPQVIVPESVTVNEAHVNGSVDEPSK